MTVYVQYHWDYNEDEEGTTIPIETQWISDENALYNDIASVDNKFLISRPWIDGLGIKIITDNIMVTDFKQTFNTMHIYVQYVDSGNNGSQD